MTATAPAKERKQLPARSEVDPKDQWDLSGLYTSDDAWEQDYQVLEGMVPELKAYKGRLSEGAATLRAFFDMDVETDRLFDKLYNYAGRRSDEDTSNSHYKGLVERMRGLATRASEATAFFRPEVMAIPDEQMQAMLASGELAPFRFRLEKVLRYKPHTLSEPEERLLALSGDMSSAAYDAFGQLNNADLRFGFIDTPDGEVEITHASYGSFLTKPDRALRERFFKQYYAGYEAHKHTLAATLAAGVKRNIFYAKARNFPSAREAALFTNNVPVSVYDNLIAAVHEKLPALYRYYDLRRRALGLDDIHFYDVMVPIVSDVRCEYAYEEGVKLVCDGVKPLGEEYVSTLEKGLLGGWVDRYENRGKRSGAYSSGCYDSDPFILMNYRGDNLNEVYTLAHEAGHSMHSWYSKRALPPQYAGYSIFVAEVASTFNEELLTAHMLAGDPDPRMRAYIINRAIDDIRSTLFRQVMFCEYERAIHERAERNEPLSLADLQRTYREILDRYYGPDFTIDPQLELECLRIPHFYFNFYVFQYATGLSAAIALSQKVLAGDEGALEKYLGFLSSGGKDFPIEILKEAGVDMTTPDPVRAALDHFEALVDQLEGLLDEIK
jgi:oligoendopeptidase F